MLQNIASYPFALHRCIKRWTHFLNARRTEYIKAEENICKTDQVIEQQ